MFRILKDIPLVVRLVIVGMCILLVYLKIFYEAPVGLTEEQLVQQQIAEFGEELGTLQRGDLIVALTHEGKVDIIPFKHFTSDGMMSGRGGTFVGYQFTNEFKESILQIVRQNDPGYRDYCEQYVRLTLYMSVELDEEGNLIKG